MINSPGADTTESERRKRLMELEEQQRQLQELCEAALKTEEEHQHIIEQLGSKLEATTNSSVSPDRLSYSFASRRGNANLTTELLKDDLLTGEVQSFRDPNSTARASPESVSLAAPQHGGNMEQPRNRVSISRVPDDHPKYMISPCNDNKNTPWCPPVPSTYYLGPRKGFEKKPPVCGTARVIEPPLFYHDNYTDTTKAPLAKDSGRSTFRPPKTSTNSYLTSPYHDSREHPPPPPPPLSARERWQSTKTRLLSPPRMVFGIGVEKTSLQSPTIRPYLPPPPVEEKRSLSPPLRTVSQRDRTYPLFNAHPSQSSWRTREDSSYRSKKEIFARPPPPPLPAWSQYNDHSISLQSTVSSIATRYQRRRLENNTSSLRKNWKSKVVSPPFDKSYFRKPVSSPLEIDRIIPPPNPGIINDLGRSEWDQLSVTSTILDVEEAKLRQYFKSPWSDDPQPSRGGAVVESPSNDALGRDVHPLSPQMELPMHPTKGAHMYADANGSHETRNSEVTKKSIPSTKMRLSGLSNAPPASRITPGYSYPFTATVNDSASSLLPRRSPVREAMADNECYDEDTSKQAIYNLLQPNATTPGETAPSGNDPTVCKSREILQQHISTPEADSEPIRFIPADGVKSKKRKVFNSPSKTHETRGEPLHPVVPWEELQEAQQKAETLARHLVKAISDRKALQETVEQLEELVEDCNFEVGRLQQVVSEQNNEKSHALGLLAALRTKEREVGICEEEIKRLNNIVESHIARISASNVKYTGANEPFAIQALEMDTVMTEMGTAHLAQREAEDRANQLSSELEAAVEKIRALDERLAEMERAEASQRLSLLRNSMNMNANQESSTSVVAGTPIPSAQESQSWPLGARRAVAQLVAHVEGLLVQNSEGSRQAAVHMRQMEYSREDLLRKLREKSEELHYVQDECSTLRREKNMMRLCGDQWYKQLQEVKDDARLVSEMVRTSKDDAEDVVASCIVADTHLRDNPGAGGAVGLMQGNNDKAKVFAQQVMRDLHAVARFLAALRDMDIGENSGYQILLSLASGTTPAEKLLLGEGSTPSTIKALAAGHDATVRRVQEKRAFVIRAVEQALEATLVAPSATKKHTDSVDTVPIERARPHKNGDEIRSPLEATAAMNETNNVNAYPADTITEEADEYVREVDRPLGSNSRTGRHSVLQYPASHLRRDSELVRSASQSDRLFSLPRQPSGTECNGPAVAYPCLLPLSIGQHGDERTPPVSRPLRLSSPRGDEKHTVESPYRHTILDTSPMPNEAKTYTTFPTPAQRAPHPDTTHSQSIHHDSTLHLPLRRVLVDAEGQHEFPTTAAADLHPSTTCPSGRQQQQSPEDPAQVLDPRPSVGSVKERSVTMAPSSHVTGVRQWPSDEMDDYAEATLVYGSHGAVREVSLQPLPQPPPNRADTSECPPSTHKHVAPLDEAAPPFPSAEPDTIPSNATNRTPDCKPAHRLPAEHLLPAESVIASTTTAAVLPQEEKSSSTVQTIQRSGCRPHRVNSLSDMNHDEDDDNEPSLSYLRHQTKPPAPPVFPSADPTEAPVPATSTAASNAAGRAIFTGPSQSSCRSPSPSAPAARRRLPGEGPGTARSMESSVADLDISSIVGESGGDEVLQRRTPLGNLGGGGPVALPRLQRHTSTGPPDLSKDSVSSPTGTAAARLPPHRPSVSSTATQLRTPPLLSEPAHPSLPSRRASSVVETSPVLSSAIPATNDALKSVVAGDVSPTPERRQGVDKQGIEDEAGTDDLSAPRGPSTGTAPPDSIRRDRGEAASPTHLMEIPEEVEEGSFFLASSGSSATLEERRSSAGARGLGRPYDSAAAAGTSLIDSPPAAPRPSNQHSRSPEQQPHTLRVTTNRSPFEIPSTPRSEDEPMSQSPMSTPKHYMSDTSSSPPASGSRTDPSPLRQ